MKNDLKQTNMGSSHIFRGQNEFKLWKSTMSAT